MYNRVLNYTQTTYQASRSTHPIVRALKKYGPEGFVVVLLAKLPDNSTVLEIRASEQSFIDAYFPEYNQLKKIQNSEGYKHTDKSKATINTAITGRTRSLESIAAQSATISGAGNHRYGKRHTE